VFRGGWSPAAAQAIVAVEGAAAEGLLAALAEQSLLRAGPRYSQHELLRQFAAEHLAADPPGERAAQARHARFFLGLLAEQAAQLGGASPQPALAAIRADLENVRQGWQSALAARELEVLAGALDGMAAFYAAAGLAQEAAELFGAAAGALEADENVPARALRGRLLTEQGNFLSQSGAYEPALQALEQAAQLGQEAGDGEAEAAARWIWGDTLGCQGRYAEARAQLNLALGLAADPATLADALGALGTIEEEQADYPAAAATYARTLALSRQLGDQRREALALQRLGVVAEEQGQYQQARQRYAESLAIHRARGNRPSEGGVLNNLGVVHRDESDYDAARAALAQALAIAREMSNPRLVAIVSSNLGDVSRDLGDYDAALDHYQQAMALREEHGNRHGVCSNLADLGLLLHLIGDDEAAREYSQRALDEARALEIRSVEAFALTHLGHALLALEQPEDAAAAYADALELRRALGQPSRALDAQAGLARARLTVGDTAGALELAEAMLAQLAAGPPHGAEEPARIALSCYQALAAARDPRAAPLLRRASHELQARAARIADPAERANFLDRVQAHQALIYAAERQGNLT
jgi:tetratricopeptide (TPR) repeat protein